MTATLRVQLTDGATDKSRWKTLRDFIDERAIEEVLETVEIERAALDVGAIPVLPSSGDLLLSIQDVIAATTEYSQTLIMTNVAIKSSLPQPSPLPLIDKVLSSQMDVSIDMARHLESLAAHFDQMAAALKDSEAGEAFSEEDLQGKKVVTVPRGPSRPNGSNLI